MTVLNDIGFPFTDQNGDRMYTSSDWREYFNALVTSGVIGAIKNELKVMPQGVPNKSIYVDTGAIMLNGALRIIETTKTLTLADNASGNSRIDRIVARLDYTNRLIEFAVKQGTPAASPSAPALTQNTLIHELSLAKITLANGYTTITAGVITDERLDEAVCGYFKYRAKPAWYPGGTPAIDAWMYTNFKDQLTPAEIANIEGNSSLMAIINTSEINRLWEAIERNSYDDYQMDLELYYGGQIDGVDLSQMGGMILDGFKDTTNTDLGTTTAAVSTTNRYVKTGSQVAGGVSINPTFNSGAGNATSPADAASCYEIIQPSRAGKITSLELYCARAATGSDGIRVSIRAVDGSNKPTGADLAYADLPFASGYTTLQQHALTLNTPVSVTVGTKYAIVIRKLTATGTSWTLRACYLTAPTEVIYGGSGDYAGSVFNAPLTTLDSKPAVKVTQADEYKTSIFRTIVRDFDIGSIQEARLFISVLERAGSTVSQVRVSVDNGTTFEALTLKNTRVDPKFTTYTEREYEGLPTINDDRLILEVTFTVTDKNEFAEVKRYGLYVR